MTKNEFDDLYGTGDKPCKTYTDTDIDLLVRIAAKQQRYACANKTSESDKYGECESDILNAPAPLVADVLAEFERMKR